MSSDVKKEKSKNLGILLFLSIWRYHSFIPLHGVCWQHFLLMKEMSEKVFSYYFTCRPKTTKPLVDFHPRCTFSVILWIDANIHLSICLCVLSALSVFSAKCGLCALRQLIWMFLQSHGERWGILERYFWFCLIKWCQCYRLQWSVLISSVMTQLCIWGTNSWLHSQYSIGVPLVFLEHIRLLDWT